MKYFLAVLLLTGLAVGQGSPHNGNWWRGQSREMRIAYVIGYYDGECRGEMRVWSALPVKVALDQQIAHEVFPKGVPYASQCLFPNETTYGQITDAVDQFYVQANNRLIVLDDAWRFIKADIEGKPLPDEELRKERKFAACDQACFDAMIKGATANSSPH